MKFKDKITSFYKAFEEIVFKISTSIKAFVKTNDVEISMFIGLFFISYATYRVSYTAFLYLIGFIFVVLSIFLLKFPLRR